MNGTGWMPVNFGLMSSGAPLGTLPVDPANTAEGGYFYTYVAGNNRYVFTIPLESGKYLEKGKLTLRDQGTDPTRLESGTNLLLWARASGLVGYWPLDQGSGITANDSSGNGNNGTLINGPAWTTGKIGSALQFDGLDDYVEILASASLTLTGNSESVFLWIRPLSDYILFHESWDRRLFYGGNNLQFRLENSAGTPFIFDSGANYPPGQFYHVGYTASSDFTIRMYVNGILTDTENILSNIRTPSGFWWLGRVCAGVGCGNYFNGTIDETRIYNRPLSATEVQRLYNATQ